MSNPLMASLIAFLALSATLFAQAPAQNVDSRTATIAALRTLVTDQRWDELDARIESFPPDDPLWERLPPVIYQAGIERNDLPAVIATLSRIANATTSPSIRAAALLVVGRAHRREGNRAAATQALEQARDAVPGAPLAEEAAGVIYEIEHLSPGLLAPPITATARDGGTISPASLRGRPVVLVFWGTT
jgi:hypothetical protein